MCTLQALGTYNGGHAGAYSPRTRGHVGPSCKAVAGHILVAVFGEDRVRGHVKKAIWMARPSSCNANSDAGCSAWRLCKLLNVIHSLTHLHAEYVLHSVKQQHLIKAYGDTCLKAMHCTHIPRPCPHKGHKGHKGHAHAHMSLGHALHTYSYGRQNCAPAPTF